jgi:hypothetical protein
MWDKIKGAIFEDGPSTPAQAKPAPTQDSRAPAPNITMPPHALAPVNDKYADALRTVLKSRSSAFSALLQGADKLVAIIPDPNTRLKAAYEMVKGEGRGVREIAAAIEVHASDLEAQRMQFNSAIEKEKQATLGALQAELDRLGPNSETALKQIESLTAQIQTLQQVVNQNQARHAEIGSQIAMETGRIETSKQQFDSALTLVKAELEGQKNIILTALS